MLYDTEIVNSCSLFAKERMIKYILSQADKVEFLVQGSLDANIGNYFENFDIFDNAFIKKYSSKSYGMAGDVYQYKLTPNIKNFFIKRCDIVSPILSNFDNVYLDNPAFLKGDEYIVSSCSHEQMHDINPLYRKLFRSTYLSIVKSDDLYQELKYKFLLCDKSKIATELQILGDLEIYLGNLTCYFLDHQLIPCNYSQFLGIANKYFTNELLVNFNHAIDFKGLFYNNFKERYNAELHYLKILNSNNNI